MEKEKKQEKIELKKINDSENKFSDSPTLKKIGDFTLELPNNT